MGVLSGRPLPPEAWECAAASLLLLWRAWTFPGALRADWVSILCAFWIVTAVTRKTRAWPYIGGAVMTGLLVFYGARQLPHTLAVLGFGP